MKITKRFEFSYAHLLPAHQGKCRRLHGHNAILEVTVEGNVQTGHSEEGMVIDFGDLRTIVNEEIVDKWDHRFLAKGDEWPIKVAKMVADARTFAQDIIPFKLAKLLQPLLNDDDFQEQFVEVGVRTTAEELARYCFQVISPRLGVQLVSAKFYETPDSWAIAEGV